MHVKWPLCGTYNVTPQNYKKTLVDISTPSVSKLLSTDKNLHFKKNVFITALNSTKAKK